MFSNFSVIQNKTKFRSETKTYSPIGCGLGPAVVSLGSASRSPLDSLRRFFGFIFKFIELVLELDKDDALGLFDDDNDINLSKIPQPILFGFVDEEYIDRSSSNSLSSVKLQHSIEKQTEKEVTGI